MRDQPTLCLPDDHDVLQGNLWGESGAKMRNLERDPEASVLGGYAEPYAYVPVKSLRVEAAKTELKVGGRIQLECRIEPAKATRNNFIWVSSNPAVASVDKFGELAAHKPGQVAVTVYSWDDAHPEANGRAPEFGKDCVQVRMSFIVAE